MLSLQPRLHLLSLCAPTLYFPTARLLREGGPVLASFAVGAVGMVVGTVAGVAALKQALGQEGAKLACCLCGRWVGEGGCGRGAAGAADRASAVKPQRVARMCGWGSEGEVTIQQGGSRADGLGPTARARCSASESPSAPSSAQPRRRKPGSPRALPLAPQ
jgi:hypothetical protein